jgi:VanZ family protein
MIERLISSPTAMRAWRLATWLLAGAMLYLSLSPAPPKSIDIGWDKANHALGFVCLSLMSSLGWAGSRAQGLSLWLMLLIFGGGIEIAQLFVPTRSAEWNDWLADALGIAIGAMLAHIALRATGRHK